MQALSENGAAGWQDSLVLTLWNIIQRLQVRLRQGQGRYRFLDVHKPFSNAHLLCSLALQTGAARSQQWQQQQALALHVQMTGMPSCQTILYISLSNARTAIASQC